MLLRNTDVDVHQVDAEHTLRRRVELRKSTEGGDKEDASAVSSGSHIPLQKAVASSPTGDDSCGSIRTGPSSYESMVNWMCREDVSRADIEKLNDAGSGDDDDDDDDEDDDNSEHGDHGRRQREKVI